MKKISYLFDKLGMKLPINFKDIDVLMVTCDSRKATKGCLFIGLKGETVDGGVFWRSAMVNGASVAIISPLAAEIDPPGEKDLVIILTQNLDIIAGEISSIFWEKPSEKMQLIGVTGTNGKTTTTYLIDYLLSCFGSSTALLGTLIDKWPRHIEEAIHTTDFPDILQSKLAKAYESGARFATMEVSSHALAQERVSGCKFDNVVFTNLSLDHLDYHKSMKSYFEAKYKLFNLPLFDSANKKAIVNIDNYWGRILADRLGDNCCKCSLEPSIYESEKVDLFISEIEMLPGGLAGRLHSPQGEGYFSSTLIGHFNLMNVLQAIGVLLQQGFSLPELLEGISKFPGVPGRMESLQINGMNAFNSPHKVLVDYAHTPDGLKNALNAARVCTPNRLICVFGCGGDRDRTKRSEMGKIASDLADCVFLTSDNPRNEDPEKIIQDVMKGFPKSLPPQIYLDRSIAISTAINESKKGDVVLIAGKGHENYQIIKTSKIYFDDREEAKNALAVKLQLKN